MSDLISPNAMLRRAKAIMLNGREPASYDDWVLVCNCIAYNIAVGEYEILRIMRLLYNIPLSDNDLEQIALFQAAQKKEKAQ